MLITDKPSRSVTARDLMTRPLAVIPQNMSLRMDILAAVASLERK
ncbi:MAG TPA: hypothetical protein VKA46_19945 [Gemmataceae bacterium]|nr:hypothetical protein [Gemmataceae bacterium]